MEKISKFTYKNLRKKLINQLNIKNPTTVVVLCLVLLGAIAVVKYFRIDGSMVTRTIQVKVAGENWANSYKQYEGFRPPYWYEEHLQQGMSAYNGQGREIAKIDSIEKYPRTGADYDIYLVITVAGYFDVATQQYIFNGQPMIVGRQITLNFPSIDLVGDIIDDDYSPRQRIKKYIEVTITQEGIDQWQYDAIHVGDTATNGNEVVAEVLKKQSKTSNLYELDSSTGTLRLKNSRDRVDSQIELRLLVERHSNSWYFGGHQRIYIGNTILISLNETNISDGVITSIVNDE